VEPTLVDHVAALEAALLEYVVKYGLTDKARAVFAASGPSWAAITTAQIARPRPRRDHHDGRPRPCLKLAATRDALAVRKEPYWNILEYGRHIGLRKLHPESNTGSRAPA
jgi:hypothetical protein